MRSLVPVYYHVNTSISALLLELEPLASGISAKVLKFINIVQPCGYSCECISVYKKNAYIETVAVAAEQSMKQAVKEANEKSSDSEV